MVPVPETTLVTMSQNSDAISAENNDADDSKSTNNNYQDEMCERLIQVSFAKIVNSKNERGGARLRKNLLILHLLQQARTEQRTRLHVTSTSVDDSDDDNYDSQDTTLSRHNSMIDNDEEDVDDFILNISQDDNDNLNRADNEVGNDSASFYDSPIDFVSGYGDDDDRCHGNRSSSIIVDENVSPLYYQQRKQSFPLITLEPMFDDVIVTSPNYETAILENDSRSNETATTNSSDEETCSDTSSSSDESDDDVTVSSSSSCKRKRKLTDSGSCCDKSITTLSSSVKRACSSSIADHQLQGLISVFQTNLSGMNNSPATGGNNLRTTSDDVARGDQPDGSGNGASKSLPTVWELTCVS